LVLNIQIYTKKSREISATDLSESAEDAIDIDSPVGLPDRRGNFIPSH
jgi:hypothetical protein